MVDNIRTIKDEMLYLLITNFYSEIDNNVLKKLFSRENVNLIDQILLDWIDNNNYSSKYFDFNSFNIILLLTIELELNKKYKSEQAIDDCLVEDLATRITKVFDYDFCIIRSIVFEYLDKISEMEIREQEIIKNLNNDEEYECCKNIIKEYQDILHFNVKNNHNIIESLGIHLRLAIERSKLNIKISNPIKDALKKRYPYLFATAIMITNSIVDKTGATFNIEEISLIVTYLSTLIQRMGRNSATFNKIYIVVIDFEQKAILNYLSLQLEDYLEKENIEIHGATSIFEYNKLMETLPAIDLLVTTSKFEKIVELSEHVIVSNDFNMIDKLKVSDSISLIKEKHNKDKFFSICDYVFKKDLFYSNVNIDNKNDLIKYCCDILEKKDIVDKRFIDSVYKREEFLSTEIDTGIAYHMV